MQARLSLALVVTASAVIAASCGSHDATPPPSGSANPGTGGTHAGLGGRGNGGTTAAGASGEGGAKADAGGASGESSGQGATSGRGGSAPMGAAGVPFSGDMGSDAGTSGAGGAPGPGDATGRIFVGPGGYDAATGTRDDPFLTLAGAASVATHGNTIVLLDGNYAIAKGADAVDIPDGVGVVADNARLASFTGNGGTLLELEGDSNIDGLRFVGFATVVDSVATGASVTVTNSSFSTCPSDTGQAVFEVGGSASVELSSDTGQDWGDCPAFGHVYAHGKLSLNGGLLHFNGSSESAVFGANDEGELDVENLTATDGDLPLLLLEDASTTTLAASTLQTLASHVVELRSGAYLDVTNTDFSLALAAPNADACIQSNGASAGALSLAHSLLHDCQSALLGDAPKTLTLDDVEIYAMSDSGIDLTTGNASRVDIENSSFHDDMARAVHLGGSSPSVFDLTVRATQVAAVTGGFELEGDATSTWDFGTLADPGGNVLTATSTSLDLQSAAIAFVTAVGNTWAPGIQGADGSGQYAASGSPGVLEVTSGSGQNYTDPSGATLRLAQNP
jgi:Protein of unknown function (DUF1565)